MSELINSLSTASHHRRERPTHPEGWEPGVQLDGERGVITSPVGGEAPDWDQLLADYLPPGWDASRFSVDPDSVSFTSWDGWGREKTGLPAVSKRQYAFRAKIVYRTSDDLEIDELVRWIKKAKPHRSKTLKGDPLVVAWADWQIGKGEGGGPEATEQRFMDSLGATQDRIRDLKPSALYILGLGDLGEACKGHYAQQKFTTVLNMRDQRKLVRAMITRGVKELSRSVNQVVVAPVGGNHGEERDGGKSYTDFADNRDVGVFEDAAEILAENADAYGHVSFTVPTKELTQTLDINGTVVGIVHGHQFGSGQSASAKAINWWKGQMEGRQPIGDADILVSGHFHHLSVVQQGSRTHMQAPALDGGSEWFRNISGLESPAGTLTFTAGNGSWDDLRVV